MLKEHPVFTARYCGILEKLRSAVEILTGKQTSVVNLDPNTGWANLSINANLHAVQFLKRLELDSEIIFRLDNTWYFSHFDTARKVIPLTESVLRKTLRGWVPIMWVGKSLVDRREQMLLVEDIEHICLGRAGIMDLTERR